MFWHLFSNRAIEYDDYVIKINICNIFFCPALTELLMNVKGVL